MNPLPVICGLVDDPVAYDRGLAPMCQERVWRTLRPASTLWCPIHGHLYDCLPAPPLHLDALFLCGPREVSA